MFTAADIFTSLPWHNYYGFFSFVWYVLLAMGLYQIFQKAGEQGWKAIIPIYNLYICFKIAGREGFFWIWILVTLGAGLCSWMSGFILLFWMGIIAWILSLCAVLLLADMWYCLAQMFGHGFLFALGLIFLNPIFIMILGYGSDYYRGMRY